LLRQGPKAPRASRAGNSPPGRAAGCAWYGASPSVRRLQRVEPCLGPGDVLTGPGEAVTPDLRARAGTGDVPDAVRPEQDEVAALDLEVVAVARAHGRPRDPIPLGVVLAAVAGAAEARGL